MNGQRANAIWLHGLNVIYQEFRERLFSKLRHKLSKRTNIRLALEY
jgi:hypothetical protein